MGCFWSLVGWLFRVDWWRTWTAPPSTPSDELTAEQFDEWWDELAIEAAERGLEGADRDRWIERQLDAGIIR